MAKHHKMPQPSAPEVAFVHTVVVMYLEPNTAILDSRNCHDGSPLSDCSEITTHSHSNRNKKKAERMHPLDCCSAASRGRDRNRDKNRVGQRYKDATFKRKTSRSTQIEIEIEIGMSDVDITCGLLDSMCRQSTKREWIGEAQIHTHNVQYALAIPSCKKAQASPESAQGWESKRSIHLSKIHVRTGADDITTGNRPEGNGTHLIGPLRWLVFVKAACAPCTCHHCPLYLPGRCED